MRLFLFLLCLVSHAFAFDWQSKVNFGDFSGESHPGTDSVAESKVGKTGDNVGFIQNGNWLQFSGFDFGTGTSRFWINAAKDNTTSGTLEIRTGSPDGVVLGSVTITDTGSWENYARFDLTLPIPIAGVQDLYFTFTGGDGYLFNLRDFGFHPYRFDSTKDISADLYSSESHPGDDTVIRKVSGQLQNIQDGAWAAYQNFDFGMRASYLWVEAAAANAGGTIEFRQGGHTGNLLGTVQVSPTGGMDNFKPFGLKLPESLEGIQDLYLKFTGGAGDLFNLRKFRFQRLAPDYKAANLLPAWEKPVLQRMMKSAGAFTSESHPADPNKVRSDAGLISYISNGTWAAYEAYDFGSDTNFFSILGSSAVAGGSLQIVLDDPDGTIIGTVAIFDTGGWGNYREFTTNLTQSVSGVRKLYFKFAGGGGSLFNLASYRFQNVGAGAKSYGRSVPANSFDLESHPNADPVVATSDGITPLTDASWVVYQNFDFGTGSNLITLEAATPGKGGAVEVRLGSATGMLVASVEITHTGSWTHHRPYTARFNQSVSGTHDLHLKFVDRFDAGGNLFDLKSFAIGNDAIPAAPTTEGSIHVYPPVPGLAVSPYYAYSVQKVSALNSPLKQDATNWLSPFAWFTECVEQGVPGVSSAYFDEFIGGWSHTYCNFEMDRNTPIVVKITRKHVTGAPSGPIFMANAHPAHKVDSCEIIGGDVYVTMREPALLTIDIDGQMDTRDAPRAIPDVWGGNYVPYKGKMNGSHAVSIFANPVIPDKPSPTGPGVRAINPGDPLPAVDDDSWTTLYFKPGIHNFSVDANGVDRLPLPGDAHTVRSGMNYYIPGDAIVYGNFDDGGDSSERKNVRFFGHGTLSGSKIRHWSEYPEVERAGHQFRMISIGSGTNCHFEGITLADPAEHGLYVHNFNGSHHRVQNSMRWLKNISWRVNNDTGSVSGGVLEDCFFRHQDDGVYLGGNDLRRCVFWSDVNGSTFRMSFFLRDKAPEQTTVFPRNVVVEDCDVIYSRGMFTFSHDTASGVIGVSPDNSSSYSDGALNTGQHLVLRNVRYTDPRPLRNFFGMDIGDPGAPGLKAWAGIRFENVESRHCQTWGWRDNFIGYPDAPIHHLYFNRVSVDGRSLNEQYLADSSRFNTSNLSNLVFIEPPAVEPSSFSLSSSFANGSIGMNPPGVSYPANTSVTLTPVPNQGYQFDSWAGDLSSAASPGTLVMDAGKSVVANFAVASGPESTRFYVNSGGPFHATQDGSPFASNISGNTFATTAPISNTTDDMLYQSERFGADFGYNVPLANGSYEVTLMFAEIYHNEPNKRLFNVSIENNQVITSLDIHTKVGKNTAYDEKHVAVVNDGQLNIVFTKILDNAKVSAIRVERIPTVFEQVVRPVDDDDGDGLANYEEYVFGLDPVNGSSCNPIKQPFSQNDGTLTYTRRSSVAAMMSYSIWYSTDLTPNGWVRDFGATQGPVVPTGTSDIETVPVRISPGLLSNQKLFIRVHAE